MGRTLETMNAKNTRKKKSPFHENADANITCNFGDGDISRSRSRLTHGHMASHTVSLRLYVNQRRDQGWVSRSQIVSQNLRSICDKHTIKLRLEKRVTGKDRKALVIHTHAQRTRSIYDDIPT